MDEVPGAWTFVALPSSEVRWTLSGKAVVPRRAQLPLERGEGLQEAEDIGVLQVGVEQGGAEVERDVGEVEREGEAAQAAQAFDVEDVGAGRDVEALGDRGRRRHGTGCADLVGVGQRHGWTGGNDRAAAGPLAMKHHESWARAEIPDDGDRRLLTG